MLTYGCNLLATGIYRYDYIAERFGQWTSLCADIALICIHHMWTCSCISYECYDQVMWSCSDFYDHMQDVVFVFTSINMHLIMHTYKS